MTTWKSGQTLSTFLQFKSNVWPNFTFSQGRQTTDVAKLAIQKARVEHFWAATLVFPLQIWIRVRNLLKWPLGGAYVVPCLLLCGTSGGQIEASFGVLSSKSIFLPLLISPHTSTRRQMARDITHESRRIPCLNFHHEWQRVSSKSHSWWKLRQGIRLLSCVMSRAICRCVA